jgi:hypothetical protein
MAPSPTAPTRSLILPIPSLTQKVLLLTAINTKHKQQTLPSKYASRSAVQMPRHPPAGFGSARA